jgi:Chemotaxis signal transduction protein
MIYAKFVVFRIGKEEYAVPISQVKEIINYRSPTTIPLDIESIVGVINLRGKVIPIIDLGKEIGIESENKPIKGEKIIIIEDTDGAFGVIVDEVEEVIKIGEDDIHKVNDIYERNKYITEIAKNDNRLIIIIDLNLFWKEVSK